MHFSPYLVVVLLAQHALYLRGSRLLLALVVASKMKVGKREASALSNPYLPDGARGMDKPSARNTAKAALTERVRSLFLSGPAPEHNSRKLQAVHSSPNLYVVPHFLTARELDHLDDLLTARRAAFKRSHTDSSDGSYVGEERTSVSLPLPKSADGVIRAIEARAADLVGLPADHVEPLQVVHYSHGARFDLHHDVAPIAIRGDDEDEAGGGGGGGGASRDESELTADDVTVEHQEGPRRLITIFCYLNTLPEGIGHTEFPLLRTADGAPFSVRPRSGTALIFCNVDEDGRPDARLCHRACPVPDGHVKFGVNIWISDVSQQAHALAAGKKAGKGGAAGGKGLLAPLLYVQPDDVPPPPPAALVGLRFSRRFDGHSGAFEGEVASFCPTNGYHLEYSDGDEEDMAAEDVLSLSLAEPSAIVGRRIAKHFPGHGRFEGEVAGCDDEAAQLFSVRFDDGDAESERPVAEVLRLLLPAGQRKGGLKARAKKRSRAPEGEG